MTYITYVTTWGTDPLALIQEMIAKNVMPNTRVMLAFASFNFAGTDYIPGFEGITISETQTIVNLVHANEGKISLSIGGATFPFYGSDLYNSPGLLASNINSVLNLCNFDGADFDIEDSSTNVPSNFANQAASLINTLKNINPELYITLTTPAQAWSGGCYQQNLINLTIGNLSAWQPMEYDLWIADGSTYYNQVQYDVNFYLTNWGVSPAKIILGLMPGLDDTGKNMSLQDALNLTSFAMTKGLAGIMTWDADNDARGVDGNAQWAYSLGIKSMCKNFQPFLLYYF